MWLAIGAVAVAVLVAAAFMGLGKFGEMPQHPVNDRPKGRVSSGPITPELLDDLRIPLASTGYRATEVDRYLAEIAAGVAAPAGETRFEVVRRGYDMQVVDELIERVRPFQPSSTLAGEGAESPPEGSDEAFTRPALPLQPGANLEDAE